ncbi:MAG: C40 family peptidase [Actinomycetota bacterium]|nr:C40 family peptidase [Actinomycetota bacterium]
MTELVAGERLEVIGSSPGWLEVVVPAHASHLDPRGYPGWVRDGALVEVTAWSPDLKVVKENPAGLPLGSLLESDGEGARLPGGGLVGMRPDALRAVGEPDGRSGVELCESLLGLPYRWGGTDSTTGMDCSGMVFRVMQLRGFDVPRDADDQYERAPFRSREGWERARIGDLIFFGEDAVTHVGFYLGDGRYISEHGSGGTVVRGVDEDPYWGFARYE